MKIPASELVAGDDTQWGIIEKVEDEGKHVIIHFHGYTARIRKEKKIKVWRYV